MAKKFFLFDLDGVLLEPCGYQKALIASVERVGKALGAPNTTITSDQIAQFEARNITNEWDTLAICAGMSLIHVWKCVSTIRLKDLKPKEFSLTEQKPDFDVFLDAIVDGGNLPGVTAHHYLVALHQWMTQDQRHHLVDLLENCRNIDKSPILAVHQEIILGSRLFETHYNRSPQFNSESFLTMFDRPVINETQFSKLMCLLDQSDHYAGILTNRPSKTPPGFLSSPEAELGIAKVGLEHLPYVGSGILCWFAARVCQLPEHTFLKPNPVHALSLLQHCLGNPLIHSLQIAANLWRGSGHKSDWHQLENAKVVIFEDSTKGLFSGLAAQQLLFSLGIKIDLTLVGVTINATKRKTLCLITENVFDNINQINWEDF